MRSPRDFLKPLCVGAPDPITEVPFPPSRMIHFLDASNEKMLAKLPDMAAKADIVLGNLEDAVPVDRKIAARDGPREGRQGDRPRRAQLWTRVNALDSPWCLDDLTTLVTEIGDKLDVIMVPKVEGPWDIHYVDRLLAQLEAKAGICKPLLVHAILETAQGVAHVDEIAAASPRMQGMSFGPADLAASRRMKTTRVGGGHPGYSRCPIRSQMRLDQRSRARITAQQDPWHYSIARMVDACTANGCLPFYGPFGDIKDVAACEAQFRAAFLLGCVGAWSLHPVQIDIAKKVFSPAGRRGALRKEGARGDPGRQGRAHDRRQDAGRRHVEAVQGHGRPRDDARGARTRNWRRRTGWRGRRRRVGTGGDGRPARRAARLPGGTASARGPVRPGGTASARGPVRPARNTAYDTVTSRAQHAASRRPPGPAPARAPSIASIAGVGSRNAPRTGSLLEQAGRSGHPLESCSGCAARISSGRLRAPQRSSPPRREASR